MTDFPETTTAAQPSQRVLDFGRECLPAQVLEHGMQDAHHRPHVGRRYQRKGDWQERFWSGRVSPDRAWRYPYIELGRTGSSYPALVLDIDSERSILAGGLLRLPVPSWATWHSNRGCHAVWCLKSPVHRYPAASRRALYELARIEGFYLGVSGADPAYAGVLVDNPIRPDRGRVTRWGVREPYTLAELAEVLPHGWRLPRAAQAVGAVGRNCTLFSSLMVWAGRVSHRAHPVLVEAHRLNGQFGVPLPENEVRDTSASVERYRAAWEAQGWHRPDWLARQAARGVASGRTRRLSTAERDAAIVDAVLGGQGVRSVARDHALHHSTVAHIVRRAESQLELELVAAA